MRFPRVRICSTRKLRGLLRVDRLVLVQRHRTNHGKSKDRRLAIPLRNDMEYWHYRLRQLEKESSVNTHDQLAER